jgi:hypothetical protein
MDKLGLSTIDKSPSSPYAVKRTPFTGKSSKMGNPVNEENEVKAFKRIWNWISFPGWLIWFFLTLPWQLKKGYSQFSNATAFTSSRESKTVKYTLSRKYYDNLN